jgi:hypothetical protein
MPEKPKIHVMGENGGMEEILWDDLPEPSEAVELADYFKKVRISPAAIDWVSRNIPSEHWIKDGLYTWVSKRADFVFSKLPSTETSGRMRTLKYSFVYDSHGPVLDRISIVH